MTSCPSSVRALFERAAGASAGGDAVLDWHGASAVHRFVHVVAGDAPVPLRETTEPTEAGREFSRLDATPAPGRARISQAGPAFDGASAPGGGADDRPDPRRLGTLVHRLLEHDALNPSQAPRRSRQVAQRLASREEWARRTPSARRWSPPR